MPGALESEIFASRAAIWGCQMAIGRPSVAGGRDAHSHCFSPEILPSPPRQPMNLFRKKPIEVIVASADATEAFYDTPTLKRTLSAFQLVTLGIGVVIGAGLFSLTGKVAADNAGPAVVLSRACPEFVKTLFRLEVSEIADGIVEVMGVARDPGFRSKIAVKTLDEKVDPVGACVGLRGVRVRNIVRELNGEKIDIVRWSDDIKQYVTQALAPARLEGVAIDPNEQRTVHVTVAPDQLSLAIGKRGQNVRLTSKLTGWRVDIQKSGEAVTFEEQRETAIAELAEVLDISEETASMLVANGFLTTDGIIEAEIPYLQEVTGMDEQTVRKIWAAAQAASGVVEEAGE